MAGKVKIPAGEKVTISHGKLQVPDHPIIAFIEGDGVGPDIWAASVRVFDAAVEQAYKGRRKIAWAETYAGEKAQAARLRPLLDDEDNAIRVAAINALRGMVDGEPPIEDLAAFEAIEMAAAWKGRKL